MPIYKYECTKCGYEEERRESINSLPSHSCPECGEISQRMFCPFGIIVSDKPAKKKLTGWRKGVW